MQLIEKGRLISMLIKLLYLVAAFALATKNKTRGTFAEKSQLSKETLDI